MSPAHEWKDFREACRKRQAKVNGEALTGAEYFQLYSEDAVQDFIGDGGADEHEFQTTEEKIKWPENRPKPLIDSYIFRSNSKIGYLAFYLSGRFVLKSLKPSTFVPKCFCQDSRLMPHLQFVQQSRLPKTGGSDR